MKALIHLHLQFPSPEEFVLHSVGEWGRESKSTIFKVSIKEAVARSCGQIDLDAYCGGKQVSTVDTGGEGGHHAAQGGLSGLVGPEVLLEQLTGTG